MHEEMVSIAHLPEIMWLWRVRILLFAFAFILGGIVSSVSSTGEKIKGIFETMKEAFGSFTNVRTKSEGHPARLSVYHNGEWKSLDWASKQKAVATLIEWNLLDSGSACFLMKASDDQAKLIISSLGPDARNPSAVVTKKLKDLQRRGELRDDGAAPLFDAVDIVVVYVNGAPRGLKWFSHGQAVRTLTDWGLLDADSAKYLLKAPEKQAKEVVSNLGPNARNPSAVVTGMLNNLKSGSLQ